MKSYKVQLIAFFYFEVHLRATSVDQRSVFRSALHTQGDYLTPKGALKEDSRAK